MDSEDPRCLNCNIPLRAIENVSDDRCTDTEACDVRRQMLSRQGGGYLLTPDSITRIEPIEEKE